MEKFTKFSFGGIQSIGPTNFTCYGYGYFGARGCYDHESDTFTFPTAYLTMPNSEIMRLEQAKDNAAKEAERLQQEELERRRKVENEAREKAEYERLSRKFKT